MYDFHYDVMKKKYGANIEICITDFEHMKNYFDKVDYAKDKSLIFFKLIRKF